MSERHLELMKLADGELEADVAEQLSGELTEEELAVLDGVEQVGDFVRALSDERSVVADDIADAVMAKIDGDGARPALREIPGGAEQPRPGPAAPEPGERRSQVLFVSGLVLAAAAAVLLWVSFQPEPQTRAPVAKAPTTTLPLPTPTRVAEGSPVVQVAQEDEAPPAASIEAVDFGNSAGSIFMVPSGEETTPVVWLVDDAQGGRMEPL